MGPATKEVGAHGEELAAKHLAASGYRLLDRNWRWRQGEIDLVVEKGGEIVFVEVKTRRSHAFGTPEEAVTRAKQRKLIRAAQAYLASRGRSDIRWRIDVIALDLSAQGEVIRLEHFENAVGEG
jgi:putative endonuclease